MGSRPASAGKQSDTATRPNEKWVADVTYPKKRLTGEFLCGSVDLARSHRPVGPLERAPFGSTLILQAVRSRLADAEVVVRAGGGR